MFIVGYKLTPEPPNTSFNWLCY